MTEPTEDFGAGLEVPAQPTPEAPATPDPVSAWIQNEFDFGGQAMTAEQFAEHVITLQTAAEESARKLAEYEARMAAMAMPSTPEPEPSKEPVVTRRFEQIQIPKELQSYLNGEHAEVDANGNYRPKTMLPQVIRACELQNAKINRSREIGSSVVEDFYGTFNEGLQHSPLVKELRDQIAELKSQLETKITPLVQSESERQFERFLMAHQKELYDDNFTPNAAGKLFAALTAKGMSQEDALAIAKEHVKAAAPAPAAPQAPAVPQPARQPQLKDNRFMASIVRRQNASPNEVQPANGLQVGGEQWKTSWSDVKFAVQQVEA